MPSYSKTLTVVSAAFLAVAAAAETVVYDGVTYPVDDAAVSPHPGFYFGPDLKGHNIMFRGCRIP